MSTQQFTASMDRLNRVATVLVVSLLVGVAVLFGVFGVIGQPPLPARAWGGIGLFPLLILVGCWVFAPRGYELDERGGAGPAGRAGP